MKGVHNMTRSTWIAVFILFSLITSTSADTLYADAKIIATGESSLQQQKGVINEHITAMYNIWKWFKAAVPDSDSKKQDDTLNSKFVVKIRRTTPELIEYTVPFGEMWARIDNNQIERVGPYRIKHGSPTGAERLEYEKTKKIPDSFKKINTDSALYIAREFLNIILRESRVGYMSTVFDSVKIDEINWQYIIYFQTKMKDDILDYRYAEIHVCAKTGNVRSYSGELNLDYNLNYIPKITKEEALTIYREHMIKNNDTAAIFKIYLTKNQRSKQRWGWAIFATPPGKGGFNYYIIIDSENGKILHDFRF